jgi:hypothetical protein
MKGINQILLQIVMILLFFTFISVALSAMGTVFEYMLLVKFWYLAFFGIIMIAVTLTLMCLIYILDQSISNYRKLDRDER